MRESERERHEHDHHQDDLIEAIRANLNKHAETYERAERRFKQEQVRLLEEMLEKARDGKPFDRMAMSRLPVPENHTEDYRVALEMLEWEVGEIIELDRADFRRYVRDEWEWRNAFTASVGAYLAE